MYSSRGLSYWSIIATARCINFSTKDNICSLRKIKERKKFTTCVWIFFCSFYLSYLSLHTMAKYKFHNYQFLGVAWIYLIARQPVFAHLLISHLYKHDKETQHTNLYQLAPLTNIKGTEVCNISITKVAVQQNPRNQRLLLSS